MEIAHDLVGKYVVTCFDHTLTVGKIVETEAYDGRRDRACHAYQKRTPRTEVMFQEGGRAYVYLCYGIHRLFNIVTNQAGFADAVLIRAIEPVIGIDQMMKRRGLKTLNAKLTAGPGVLSQAMGIDLSHNNKLLFNNDFFIAMNSENPGDIISDRRVGVDYAGEDAKLPWRFFIDQHPCVSKLKQKAL